MNTLPSSDQGHLSLGLTHDYLQLGSGTEQTLQDDSSVSQAFVPNGTLSLSLYSALLGCIWNTTLVSAIRSAISSLTETECNRHEERNEHRIVKWNASRLHVVLYRMSVSEYNDYGLQCKALSQM